ncbi:hypothetical protein VN1338_45650 [Helicobacter pylori]
MVSETESITPSWARTGRVRFRLTLVGTTPMGYYGQLEPRADTTRNLMKNLRSFSKYGGKKTAAITVVVGAFLLTVV